MPFSPEVEQVVKTMYGSLREKDRRRYAAVEAAKLGHGGVKYIADLLDIDPKSIRQGQRDLDNMPDVPPNRSRKKGGGRKRRIDTEPQLDTNFQKILEDHTAGDPMKQDSLWTNLSKEEISNRLEDEGTPAGPKIVQQLLDLHNLGRRQAFKNLSMGQHEDRNAQFENIASFKARYLDSLDPILSIDTKKRELMGLFYRDGQLYVQKTQQVWDHDFPSFGTGVVIPHGLYDLKLNSGYLNLGTSRDTSEFAGDSIWQWWSALGQFQYPHSKSLMLLCDGGGSNSSSRYLFKEALQHLAQRIGFEIRVAHYPPYTSKYNLIEHRFFPQVTRACKGVILQTVEQARYYMAKTKTSTGLSVVVNIVDKVYQTGKKVAEGFKENMKLVFDAVLPKWNYRALPA